MDLNMLKFFIALHSFIEAMAEIMIKHMELSVGDRTKLIVRKHNLDQALDVWRVNTDGTAKEG